MSSNAHHNQAYQTALVRISGAHGEPSVSDFDQAVNDLHEMADVFPPAMAKLAALQAMGVGGAFARDDANNLLLGAAKSGFPPAIRELGVQALLSGTDTGMGAGLLCQAASRGDWIAGFLILREACRGHYFLSAKNLKGLAGQLSSAVPFRDDILKKIDHLNDDISAIPLNPFREDKVRTALNDRGHQTDTTDILYKQPTIRSHQSVLTPLECDYLIAISCASMQSSKVVSSEAGDSIRASFRTSEGTVLLPHMLDYTAVRIAERLTFPGSFNQPEGEFLSLLRYMPGQEYRPHHDYLDEDANDYSMVKTCGQRRATLLTYLNEDYDGGETEFPELGIKYRGTTGDSLYFENTDENGRPIPNSLHAGLPVTSGEKWLATVWIREKPFWPWARES